MIRRGKVIFKKTTKTISIIIFSTLIFLLLFFFIFRPSYEVKYKGKFVGYSSNFFDIKEKVAAELLQGDEKVAFYDLEEPIEYTLTFLKRNFKENNDLIKAIKEEAIANRRYYVVKENGKAEGYFKTHAVAEMVVNQLKEKGSANISEIDIKMEYLTEKHEFSDVDLTVEKLYKAKSNTKTNIAKTPQTQIAYTRYGQRISYSKVNINMEFTKPLVGPVSSRFQPSRTILGRTSPHTGIDIARPTGTPIIAAQSGYVTTSSYSRRIPEIW